MNQLIACLKKDLLLLSRDKVGLLFMFLMPVVLAILITAVQNSTFDLVNNNRIKIVIENQDSSLLAVKYKEQLLSSGLFKETFSTGSDSPSDLRERMKETESLVGVLIPENFSWQISTGTAATASRLLDPEGKDTVPPDNSSAELPLVIVYDPVLQESFRKSVRATIEGAMRIVESEELLATIYEQLEATAPPAVTGKGSTSVILEEHILGSMNMNVIPNASQHNVPAWTIFAMFFVVISLGSNIVKEKQSGSFLRLRSLPAGLLKHFISKEITYLSVTVLQAAVIFFLGRYMFPVLGLPTLNMPSSVWSLVLMVFFTGWCAVSFALCMGVFTNTQEQNNGLGAGLVIILAALGGIIVPYFAMPHAFEPILKFSPMHWSLKGFYVLFLGGGNIKDIFTAVIPLAGMILALHLLALWKLRKKHLI